MKRVTIAVIAFIALLALSAPFVLAADDPSPPTVSGGGCSGSDCK
jgi:hypothetical protein